MTSVCLVIPAHRRHDMSRLCFAAIAWCVRELRETYEVDARALVVADDENLNIADELGLDTLDRPNSPLGRKWNDGYELAYRDGVDYVMSLGSDDWLDPAFVKAQLLAHETVTDPANTIMATHRSTTVSPDGSELALLDIPYAGGDGVRLIPRAMLARVKGRPTRDDRDRAIDGGMRDKLSSLGPLLWNYLDSDPLSIVDFKTPGENLTSYPALVESFATNVSFDPWGLLAGRYPASLVDAARNFYAAAKVTAA